MQMMSAVMPDEQAVVGHPVQERRTLSGVRPVEEPHGHA
jgi:hypothetical protein